MTHRPPLRMDQSAQQEPSRRPRSVAAVAVVLILVGGLSALAGITLSAASSCCGSPDPADPTPSLVGVVVAAALSAAGVGLWSGRMSRRVLLLCGAAVPAVVIAVSPSSSDFQGLAPVALLGWLWLWWYLRRPVATGWIGRGAPDHQ
jgi:hypothetical protein